MEEWECAQRSHKTEKGAAQEVCRVFQTLCMGLKSIKRGIGMQGRLWMREKSDKPAKLTTIAVLVECATTTSLPFLNRLSV